MTEPWLRTSCPAKCGSPCRRKRLEPDSILVGWLQGDRWKCTHVILSTCHPVLCEDSHGRKGCGCCPRWPQPSTGGSPPKSRSTEKARLWGKTYMSSRVCWYQQLSWWRSVPQWSVERNQGWDMFGYDEVGVWYGNTIEWLGGCAIDRGDEWQSIAKGETI